MHGSSPIYLSRCGAISNSFVARLSNARSPESFPELRRNEKVANQKG